MKASAKIEKMLVKQNQQLFDLLKTQIVVGQPAHAQTPAQGLAYEAYMNDGRGLPKKKKKLTKKQLQALARGRQILKSRREQE